MLLFGVDFCLFVFSAAGFYGLFMFVGLVGVALFAWGCFCVLLFGLCGLQGAFGLSCFELVFALWFIAGVCFGCIAWILCIWLLVFCLGLLKVGLWCLHAVCCGGLRCCYGFACGLCYFLI